jgi:hypothetical protein
MSAERLRLCLMKNICRQIKYLSQAFFRKVNNINKDISVVIIIIIISNTINCNKLILLDNEENL